MARSPDCSIRYNLPCLPLQIAPPIRESKRTECCLQETPFNLKLIEKLPILQEVYERIPWLWNGHVETIFASQTRKNPNLEYNRRLVELEDGGVVALDFEPIEMDKVSACMGLVVSKILPM